MEASTALQWLTLSSQVHLLAFLCGGGMLSQCMHEVYESALVFSHSLKTCVRFAKRSLSVGKTVIVVSLSL